MTKKIVVVGAGGHGKSVADSLLLQNEYELIGFVDDAYPNLSEVWGFPVLGKVTAETFSSLQGNAECFVVAIGNNELRESIFKLVDRMGLNQPSIVHHKAFVSSRAMIGKGCVVMANAVIGTEAKLGNGVIVNSGAIVDHHAVVDDFGHLGVNASMAGGAHLGRSAWAQAGVTLGYGVVIPDKQILKPGESR